MTGSTREQRFFNYGGLCVRVAATAPEDLRRQYENAVKGFPDWWTTHFGPWASRFTTGVDHPEYLPLPTESPPDDDR